VLAGGGLGGISLKLLYKLYIQTKIQINPSLLPHPLSPLSLLLQPSSFRALPFLSLCSALFSADF